jgi:DNA mismatch repair protein MSH4
MSGKTTHLRQLGHLIILSHLGCYIPATFASFRIIDRIFTRIGNDDSIENNMSSFMMEMKEMAYIINNSTNKSVILIDELGRSSSSK